MTTLDFGNGIRFNAERQDKKLRLVVCDRKGELACRKESFSKLNTFLEAGEARLFKGRLQLYKKDQQVRIELKGAILGIVPGEQLLHCLVAAKQLS